MVRRGDQDFVYDISDQPVRADAEDGSGHSTYTYDGNLRRVRTVVHASDRTMRTLYSVYLSDGELVHVEDVAEGEKKDYVRGKGRLLAVYTNGVPEYAHTDHLGTVQVATTDAGLMRPQTYYTPFGEAMDGPAQASARPELDLGLTGHLRDRSTGLTYMQARYHDPVVGRFLSVDPVTFGETNDPRYENRYIYAGNDPVGSMDPNGQWIEDLFIGVPSAGLGVWSATKNIAQGNFGAASIDVAGVGADIAAIAAPGVPGGAGLAIQATRKGAQAADAAVITKVVGNAQPTKKGWCSDDAR